MVRSCSRVFTVALVAGFLGVGCARDALSTKRPAGFTPCILVILDGLRIDYVTPEVMPNLNALGASGVVFESHHAIFPTSDIVNAASLITGAYPASHGLFGNLVYVPGHMSGPVDLTEEDVITRLDRRLGGSALTALTLGELLEGLEENLLAVSSAKPGIVDLLGYRTHPRPDKTLLIQPGRFRPAEIGGEVVNRVGPFEQESGETDPHAWAVEVFLEYSLGEDRPALSILWLGEPDRTQHQEGVGSPAVLQAARSMDRHLGRLLEAIRQEGLWNRTNLIVTSDHGFISHNQALSVEEALLESGLLHTGNSGEVVLTDNQIYLGDREKVNIEAWVAWLAARPQIGGLFTRNGKPGQAAGRVPGTLSYDTIHAEGPRAGDILFVPNWRHEKNPAGYAGRAGGAGGSGHGGGSPYEIRIPMVASGPGFKKGAQIREPSSNIDVAPTLLSLLGIRPPDSMDGRVLDSALKDPNAEDQESLMTRTYRAEMVSGNGVRRRVEVRESAVGPVAYTEWVRALYREDVMDIEREKPEAEKATSEVF